MKTESQDISNPTLEGNKLKLGSEQNSQELITEENGASESCIRLTKQFEVHILIIFRISFFEVNGVINLSYTN